ncbi:OmpP1/FadL family transporter [Muriicola soli]|uniref:Aromatic hydrocarbon degradation protein n=1 Tax=Muriicola soli TaxID=2507538 RepID=A0A411EBC9_9FLAO|nr:aromatic hydrocarbon degradation protein [Muriicola soli]QBA64750.1 aromatic hydrocarbon degradation protein [Muriicola soli]
MKRFLTFITGLLCLSASAQNIDDVLRYSTENLQGTARFQAMGGAFGALGGDMSALNINPAGSAVFANSLFTITGTNYHQNNESVYFGSLNSEVRNSTDINQLGGVFVFKSRNPNSPWQKLALAFNYDMARNFDNEVFTAGNSNSSIDNYFLNFAQGVPFGPLLVQDGEFIEEAYLDIGANLGFREQQAFLGYYGGVIDPVDESDNNNTAYVSNALYNTVNQELFRRTNGYNSKLTMNFSGQYQQNLFIGASLNFHTVLYDQYTEFTETGYDAASEIQFINFDNYLRTEGSGFSFSLGAIAKLNENVRLGGSYQSPTWYRLLDDTSQRINSDLADSEIGFIDFNVVNLFDEYTVRTPAKVTGSLAIIFGPQGLLSFDYGYQDMAGAELRPGTDPRFNDENTFIASQLGGVNTIRIGGEYRIENISLRGGYRFESSPYVDGVTIGDLEAISLGIGFNFGGSRLDLAFSRSEQSSLQQLFSSGFPNLSLVDNINTNILLGYTLNL